MPQAEAVTTVFREVREADFATLATKADIERLQGQIERLEASTNADIGRLERKIETEIAKLASKLENEIVRLDTKLEIVRRDVTIRLGSMIVVATGILLAAKFLG